jgi:ubiquitin carboxyl-terminal hydrolase L5
MLQYEDSQLSFNLLALCRSSLTTHTHKIAGNLASLKALLKSIRSRPEFATFEPGDKWLDETNLPCFLSEFQLTPTNVENAPVPQTLHEKALQLGSEAEANELYESIVVDTKAVMGEYRAELISMAEDEQRVKGRKKDFGPALHKWVTKLAQKGVLQGMISSG